MNCRNTAWSALTCPLAGLLQALLICSHHFYSSLPVLFIRAAESAFTADLLMHCYHPSFPIEDPLFPRLWFVAVGVQEHLQCDPHTWDFVHSGKCSFAGLVPPVPNTEITTVIIAKPLSLSEGKDFHCFKKQCTAYRSLIMLRKKAGTSTVSPTQHLRNMLGSVLMFAKGNSPVMETISGVSSDSYLTSNTFTHIKQFPSRWRISTDIMETA